MSGIQKGIYRNNIEVSQETHRRLKMIAASKNIPLRDLVAHLLESILKNGIKLTELPIKPVPKKLITKFKNKQNGTLVDENYTIPICEIGNWERIELEQE